MNLPGDAALRRRCGNLKGGRPSPGFILIAVLVVVMLASMVVVSLLFRLRAEETAAVAGAGGEQALAAAMSGVQEAIQAAARVVPGNLVWQDNPTLFRERLVSDDGADRWYFSVYSPGDPDQDGIRFGLTDEASKVNLNEATEANLEKLPKITPYLVQGLLDFLDSDDVARPEGAEQEYYSTLPVPYRLFNHSLATIDELLLVRGFTPALLYGEDANWNFQLDTNEDDGEVQFPPDNKDGKLDSGWRAWLTVSSYDLNVDNRRVPRLQVNQPLPESATNRLTGGEELPATLLTYLEALHRNQLKLEHPVDLLEARGKFKPESGDPVELESGVGKDELPLVLDRFTASDALQFRGLLNVNTASATVLRTIPGIDEALADSIVSARRNLRPEQRRTPAWLYQEGVMDAAQLKKTIPYLTARAFQYHCQVVGYGVPSGRYRVLEVIIDTAGSQPTVQYLRDLTRLGLPFKIETQSESEHSSSARLQPQRRPDARETVTPRTASTHRNPLHDA